MRLLLVVETGHSFLDDVTEGVDIDEGAIGEIMLLEVARHRSLIASWAVKPSVQRLSGDECPCRVMVLSAVGVSRRMMVSEAPAS